MLCAARCFSQEPAPEIPALVETANTAHLKGDYEASRQALLKAWELAEKTPRADSVRYDVLKRLLAQVPDGSSFLYMQADEGQSDLSLIDNIP